MQYQTKRKKATDLIFQIINSLKTQEKTGDLKILTAEVSIQTGMKTEEVEEMIKTFETAKRICIIGNNIEIN